MDIRLLILAVIHSSIISALNYPNNTIPGHLDIDQASTLAKQNAAKTRIIGGIEVTPHSRPYQAGLIIPISTSSIIVCGASIIDQMNLLTAAHCVDTLNGSLSNSIVAYLGTHNMPPTIADNAVAVITDDVVVHPQWDRSTFRNDIALVRLTQPVQFTATVNRILLPQDDSHDYLGNSSLVTGWGTTNETTTGALTDVLMELSSHIMSNYACSLAYLGSIEDSHICMSSYTDRATCGFDSGGPLTVNGVQVGIDSFGSEWGCAQGFPSVFTRVTHYLDWIHQNLIPVPSTTTTTTTTTTTPAPTPSSGTSLDPPAENYTTVSPVEVPTVPTVGTTVSLDPPQENYTTVSPVEVPTVPTVGTTVSLDPPQENYTTVSPVEVPTVPTIGTTVSLDPPQENYTTVSPVEVPTVPTVGTTVSLDPPQENYTTVSPVEVPTVPTVETTVNLNTPAEDVSTVSPIEGPTVTVLTTVSSVPDPSLMPTIESNPSAENVTPTSLNQEKI